MNYKAPDCHLDNMCFFAENYNDNDTLVLHHHEQKVEGPIIEMPSRYHDLGIKRQHMSKCFIQTEEKSLIIN